jgi:hypothetical protein
MAPSRKTTNLLWGNAGGLCAICKIPLSVDATSDDKHATIGDVAHIVASSIDGPRGGESRPADIDGYENLILLCKNDHKMVDDQPQEYSVDDLRQRRASHERWVKARLRADRSSHLAEGRPRPVRTLRYGPSEWLPRQQANGPEMLLRCAAALPGATVDSFGHPGERSGLLSREDREGQIKRILDSDDLTLRFRRTAESWGWSHDKGWEVQGGAPGPELTDLRFNAEWPNWRIRQALELRCAVLTGWTPDNNDLQRGIVVVVDLGISLLELGSDRRPSEMAYRTTPPPAPAALRLPELVALLDLIVRDTGRLAVKLAGPLIGLPPETGGELNLWMQHDGAELGRLLDLRHLVRLPGPTSSMRASVAAAWPLAAHGPGASVRELTRRLIEQSLEDNDYRGLQDALNAALPIEEA